eukprot:g7309.t1
MAVRTTTPFVSWAAKAPLILLVGLIAAAHARVDNEADPVGIMKRSLSTSSTGSVCSAESSSCIADQSCIDCFTVLSEGQSSCDAGVANDSCDGVKDFYCCALEQEGEECTSNSVFANYFECVTGYYGEQVGCGSNFLDLSDCNGATGRASSSWSLSFLTGCGTLTGVMVAIFGLVV